MPRSLKSANPFYGMLLAAGIVFALTATAYVVMAFRETRPEAVEAAEQPREHPLMKWMSRHGETALIAELVVLAICTCGAIGTDDYWQRRANHRSQ